MGNIVKNIACPKCRETGHDKTSNHAIVFSDGGIFCGRTQFHKDGKKYYVQGEEGYDVTTQPINGDIQYSAGEFRELESAGKLKDPLVRALALGGMRKKDAYEVMNEAERSEQEAEWQREVDWFSELKVKHLADRGVHGLIAKLYNVRVGHDEQGVVNRHYYPRYEQGELVGAKCRTLPKDFAFGHLGKLFGNQEMFGMQTFKEIAESGQRKKFLLVVGGECDVLASQQMFIKEMNGLETLGGLSSLDGLKKFYVLGVTKGETGIQELIDNKEQLDQFETILWCFDNDEVGQKLNKAATKLFRGKSKTVTLPAGCKDPNDCLNKGRDSEFVTALFNAKDAKTSAKVKHVSEIKDKARQLTEMGKKYWLNGLNMITYGIRLNYLSVWGAGTGVN